MAKFEDIEIHSGKVDFGFKPIRRLEVKCETSSAFMPAPTIDEANGRLRALASSIGANAILEAKYDSGISLTSWKSLKATGLAVVREPDDRICPTCAETVKRAAAKCRFCGTDLEPMTPSDESTVMDKKVVAPQQDASEIEPLTDNNNPAIVISLIFVALFVILMMIGAQR